RPSPTSGAGARPLDPTTPPPALPASMLIAGTSQPGFAGTPLIALGGPAPGSPGPLVISGGDVTIRGLAVDRVAIDAPAGEDLIAVAHAQGTTTQLSLLDSLGHELVQSRGVSPTDPSSVLDEHLAAGNYSLAVDATSGQGTYTLTTMLMPAAAPFQPIPVGHNPFAIAAGDLAGNRLLDLAVGHSAFSGPSTC